ncbi:NAD-dependent epimerase/dehydratase family protein [Primorskyibacter flagellatus]|uniref:UDP-glucose 4-epimerase n=1 Tax=Primorskyibacter flagellatus TaxID=1387277 RepID=A0A1W2E0K5_9RHOB|nr:NAD(P)-dependent oxidoreductase [Primorskyibacter flagellatus]SMD03294.1 UDP-glucose 4-epimerase [Primorskyibacter flagellatus]
MILLEWDRTARQAPGVAAVFGTGLIGRTAIDALRRNLDCVRLHHMQWDWSSDTSGQARQIAQTVRNALDPHEDAVFATIWAAGHSGFGTDPAGMQTELAALEDVMNLVQKIGATLPPNRRCFIHTSSAGGLFEGQTACGANTKPVPLRPYGEGKLAQEACVRNSDALGRRHILRPSSVYGYVPGARRGLFTVLVATALQGKTARIMGAMNTLRDYIFADDIGRFISDLVCNHASNPISNAVSTTLLASGRPAAIYEVINVVKACVGRPLFIKIDPHPENARHNTFLRTALPRDFKPTGLHEGIALTVGAVCRDRFQGAFL